MRASVASSVLPVVLFAIGAQAHAGVMYSAVNPANGKTYSLLTNSTWTEAEAEAVTLGGHLVTINDAAEEAWVLATFSPSSERHIWIGLNDEAVEGSFVWTSGEPVTYTHWGLNEPDNLGNEDYAYMDINYPDTTGVFWNDLRNLTSQIAPSTAFIPLHGVVEFDLVATVPEPASATIWAFGGLALLAYRSRRKQVAAATSTI